MNSDNVVNKILSDAKERAAKITDEAKAKTALEKAGLERQIGEYKKQSCELAEKAAEETKRNILAHTRMDASKKILQTKRKLLNDVFEKTKERLVNLPEQEYLSLMKKLILKSVQTGDEEILLAENEKKISREFVNQINRELGSGFKGCLKLSDKKVSSVGGFVLKRGSIYSNSTIEILVEQAKTQLESDIARELFNS